MIRAETRSSIHCDDSDVPRDDPRRKSVYGVGFTQRMGAALAEEGTSTPDAALREMGFPKEIIREIQPDLGGRDNSSPEADAQSFANFSFARTGVVSWGENDVLGKPSPTEVYEEPETFAEGYELGDQLAKGEDGTVYQCSRVRDNEAFAVKVCQGRSISPTCVAAPAAKHAP